MEAARRLVKGDAGSRINEEALAAFGLVAVGDVPDHRIAVWPENEKTVEVFIAMGTQWNVAGMGGPVGLRYEALPTVMRFCAVPAADRAFVFHGIRQMESAALEVSRG